MDKKNEVLGKIGCESCGGSCDVMQAKRKGAELYTRCTNCGIDQRNGVHVQSRLYFGTVWADGKRIAQPAKASAEVWESMQKKPLGQQTEKPDLKEKPTETADLKDKAAETVTEEPAESKPKGLAVAVIGLGIAALAGVVCLG